MKVWQPVGYCLLVRTLYEASMTQNCGQKWSSPSQVSCRLDRQRQMEVS